jgi:hypothetical protein
MRGGCKWAVTKFAFDIWNVADKKEIVETPTLEDEEI